MSYSVGSPYDKYSYVASVQLKDGRNKLYQWDENVHLLLTGVRAGDEVHFDSPASDEPLAESIYEQGREFLCEIPNVLLQNPGKLKLWVYVNDDIGSRTVCEHTFKIEPREKPPIYNGNAYILIDEDGNEIPAILVGEEVVFTATEEDIRLGAVAATEKGVTVGKKEIPAYHTTEGRRTVKSGRELTIPMYSDKCQYSKLQVIICSEDCCAEMVVFDDKLYSAKSTTPLSEVTVDTKTQTIKLGYTNDTGKDLLIRYMSIKEDE